MRMLSVLSAAALALVLGTGVALAAATPAAGNHYNWNPKQGDRATQALNLLEAKGYGNFTDFKADGNNFEATVQQHGKTMNVVVDPITKMVQPTG